MGRRGLVGGEWVPKAGLGREGLGPKPTLERGVAYESLLEARIGEPAEQHGGEAKVI